MIKRRVYSAMFWEGLLQSNDIIAVNELETSSSSLHCPLGGWRGGPSHGTECGRALRRSREDVTWWLLGTHPDELLARGLSPWPRSIINWGA